LEKKRHRWQERGVPQLLLPQLSVVRSNDIERQRKTQNQAQQQQPCSERHATLTNPLHTSHVCMFIHSFIPSFILSHTKVNEFVRNGMKILNWSLKIMILYKNEEIARLSTLTPQPFFITKE